jgi:hypothetical protein
LIEPTWLNDRDQFLCPNEGWKTDTEFQNDCLIYTLLHGQNRISANDGTNHWIPYYDIKEYFQGRSDKGIMNTKSDDDTYNALLTALRETLKALTLKIQPKVYQYGFLKE